MAAQYVQQPYNSLTPPKSSTPLENSFATMNLGQSSNHSSRPSSGSINWAIRPEEISGWEEYPLGGAAGNTYKAKLNGHSIAVKRIPAETKRQPITDYILRSLSLKHENILPVWGASPEDVNPPYLVFPFLTNGNAKDFLNRFSSVSRLEFVKGIAVGMAYLHSLNIIHGRLKTSNILVNERGKPCIVDHGLYQIGTMPTSTSTYFSPEAWKGKVSKASDVYAFSMVTYELLSNSPPWGILSETQVYQLVVREGERPDRPEEDAIPIADREWALLGLCWKAEPSARPAFADIVEMMETGVVPTSASPAGSQGVPSGAASGNEAHRESTLDTIEPAGPPPPSYDAVLGNAGPGGAPGIAVTGSSPIEPNHAQSSSQLGTDILGRPLPQVAPTPAAPAIDSFRPIPSYGPNQYPPEKVGLYNQPSQQRADNRISWMSQPSNSSYGPSQQLYPSSSSQPATPSSSSQYGNEPQRRLAVTNPNPPGSPMTPPPTHFSAQYPQFPPIQQQFTGESQSVYPIGSPPPSGSPRQQSFYPGPVAPLQSATASASHRPGFDEHTTFPPARHMSPVPEGYMPHDPHRQFSASPAPIDYHPGYDLVRPGTSASTSSQPFSPYGSTMSPTSRPLATTSGRPSAVILAGALHSEVTGERNRERIDGLLVEIQRLAYENSKEVEKFITAGVVSTLITLLKARAVQGHDLALVLKTLGILAYDSVSANTIFRTKTADVLCEIIDTSTNQEAVLLAIWCISRISRNAELAMSLVKTNIVPMLLQKGLKASPQTASMTSWALGNLIYTDSLADTVSGQGAAQACVDNLALSIRSGPEDMCAAIYPIARMSRSIKLAKMLAKCGCIGPLVHCLTTSENSDVLMWSARAVGCLMRPNSADMSHLLLDAGAADGLARLPRVLPAEVIEPLESFAFAISRFSCAEWGSGTRKKLVEAGVVDSLLAALRTAADVPYPKVHIELALAVSFLGDVGGGDLRKEIVRAGGIEILKRVGAAGNKEVSKACSMAVTSITGNIWSRNAASAKTAMSHDWSGGCPDYQPPSPL